MGLVLDEALQRVEHHLEVEVDCLPLWVGEVVDEATVGVELEFPTGPVRFEHVPLDEEVGHDVEEDVGLDELAHGEVEEVASVVLNVLLEVLPENEDELFDLVEGLVVDLGSILLHQDSVGVLFDVLAVRTPALQSVERASDEVLNGLLSSPLQALLEEDFRK